MHTSRIVVLIAFAVLVAGCAPAGPTGPPNQASPTEGKLSFTLWAGENRPELPVLAANWRQIGFDVQERLVPPAESVDPQPGSTFPALSLSASGATEVQQMALYRASQVRSAETRWRGENLSGWKNPAYDQLVDAFNFTLDPNERAEQRAQMAKLLSEELPSILLTHNPTCMPTCRRSRT